jgi:hypothetical protein
MDNPTLNHEMPNEVGELAKRVMKLEDEVFKGGPPGFGERLAALSDELDKLQNDSSNQIQSLDKKIDDTIRILAEVRQLVAKMGKQAQAW